MNAEEFLQNIDEQLEESNEDLPDTIKERNRLSAIIVGGNSKKYLGKELKLSDIDSMETEQIKKLYCKYEARLGAIMTKTLGNTFINLYVMGILKYFNIPNPSDLIQDLEEDPFVNQALNNTCCELYYRFGMYLAPFTAMLTTVKHIKREEGDGHKCSLKRYENNELKNDD
jgi:hypothetical protein